MYYIYEEQRRSITRDCRSIWPELNALISTSLHPIKTGHHILEVNMEVKLSLCHLRYDLFEKCQLESTADNRWKIYSYKTNTINEILRKPLFQN